jgi:hypothetical protein
MQTATKHNPNNIHWKYILFNTNDTIELLNKAQTIAKDIGIARLEFIITHCGAVDGTVKPSPTYKTLESIYNYIQNNPIFQHTKASLAT